MRGKSRAKNGNAESGSFGVIDPSSPAKAQQPPW